ncbi:NADH-ubiquinone oxidoreductase-F iron-sulfur binding region domain-containing protein [Rhodococcus koreensis]
MSATTDVSMDVATATYPGLGARLLNTAEREDLERYRSLGGYAALADAAVLLTEVENAGLRGRGGAAFPLGRKLRAVKAGSGVPVVVANGEEGEPASIKDRWLMRYRPHLVLDGARLAAGMVGADEVYLYVSDPASARSLDQALTEARSAAEPVPDMVVHEVAPSYVAGEETAAVRSINGGPALPADKPPRPFEEGIGNRPTLVSNVETLANLPFVQRHGGAEYRSVGTADSPGTFLLTLTGTAHDGLYEVPFGATLAEVLRWLDDRTQVTGALVGGYFSGVLSERVLDLPFEYAAFRTAGSGLGCGAIAVIDAATCPVAVSTAVLDFFDRENAGQCGSCFNGTAAMAAALRAVSRGQADTDDLERLRGWSQSLRGRGACGTLDGATNVTSGVLREFPDLVASHMAGTPCRSCAAGVNTSGRPYAVIDEEREVLR